MVTVLVLASRQRETDLCLKNLVRTAPGAQVLVFDNANGALRGVCEKYPFEYRWLPAKPAPVAGVEATRLYIRTPLVCKIDDDIYPLRHGWLDSLLKLHNPGVGYVTGLINNNCWGWLPTLNHMGLLADAVHRFPDTRWDHRECRQPAISDLWHCGKRAQYVHQNTSLRPQEFLARTKGLAPEEIKTDTYSIGLILATSELYAECWGDDEIEVNKRCQRRNLPRLAALSEPVIHYAYYPQRATLDATDLFCRIEGALLDA